MCILPCFRKMGGPAVIAHSGTLWLPQPMKTVCAMGGQLLILFGLAHLSLLCAPKMFWCTNPPMLSVSAVEEKGVKKDTLDAK